MRNAKYFWALSGFSLVAFALMFVQTAEAGNAGNVQTYNTDSTQQMNRGNVGYAYSGTSGYPYPNQYNTHRSATTLPGYNETYYPDIGQQQRYVNPGVREWRVNDRLNVRTSPQVYESDYASAKANSSNLTFTEPQLMTVISPQERALYFGLDSEGKALALQLASQGGYQNKGLAIKEAQRRMNERQGAIFSR